jgi:transposase
MDKENKHQLTEADIVVVREAMKSPIRKVAKRASVLYSLHLGYTPEAVAELQDISLATVYNHYQRFKREGLEGLADKPKSGRPPKADEAYRQVLAETLETEPETLGLGFGIWTMPRLCLYLREKTGVDLSKNRLASLLSEMGYVYRRPKKDPSKAADPLLREEFKQRLAEVKKAPQTGKLSFSLWMKADAT